MSTESQPEVQMIEVDRHEVTLTMDDLLTPLSQTEARLNVAGIQSGSDPVVATQLARFTELINALQQSVAELNQRDPSLLASRPGPAPEV